MSNKDTDIEIGKQSILWERRCKICNLANSHPELFKDLHLNVIEVGMSYNRALNILNDKIEKEFPELSKFNAPNMSSHFNSHISIPEKVTHEVIHQAGTPPSLQEINPEVGGFIQDMVNRKIGNEVSDYLNLDSLRSQMLSKLELLDTIIEKTDPNGDKIVDLDAMGYYTSLIKEIRSCIVDLNKIRQSKQLMGMIIKSLIEKSSFSSVRQLSREYDQIKQDLLSVGVDPTIVTRIDQDLRIKLAEIISSAARDSVSEVIRYYKLG